VSGSLRLASIDLGTNSTRLLVAGCDGARTETLDRRAVITRLGEGVDQTRRLLAPAVERTLEALRGYRAAMDALGPQAVSAAATSVLRDCENGEEFLDAAAEVIGERPVILSGAEEARLSYIGAISDLDPQSLSCGDAALVFDIGGGSTELMMGDVSEGGTESGLLVTSVDVGCVRMSERFLTSDPPSPISIGRMESYIVSRLKPAVERLVSERPSCAIGLAGTVTTISAINQGLKEYDTDLVHHSRLTLADVRRIYLRLVSVPLEERKRVMGLEPERADIIVGGAGVLEVLMELAGLDEILVSEKDILDGLVLDLFRALSAPGR